MNMDQKRKSCRMVSSLRHILPICKEEGVGGNSHNVPSYPTLSLFLLLPPPLPPLPLLLIRNNSDLATLTGMHE